MVHFFISFEAFFSSHSQQFRGSSATRNHRNRMLLGMFSGSDRWVRPQKDLRPSLSICALWVPDHLHFPSCARLAFWLIFGSPLDRFWATFGSFLVHCLGHLCDVFALHFASLFASFFASFFAASPNPATAVIYEVFGFFVAFFDTFSDSFLDHFWSIFCTTFWPTFGSFL